MKLTLDQLAEIMPRLRDVADAPIYLDALNLALAEFEINTPQRAAACLAQIAHESGELRYWEEIWGANGGTAAQKRYEGRRDLGNTQPGDGYRYRGRGPIQLTGRANYRKAGKALGVDLENEPDKAASPFVGFRIAGWFWKSNLLNPRADIGTDEAFKTITRKINGGFNGLEHRRTYWKRAKRALGVDA